MLSDIWTVFWRDWVVLKHRMTAFILSRMVAPLQLQQRYAGPCGTGVSQEH